MSGLAAFRIRDGRPGVVRVILTLTRIAAECERRTAVTPDAALATLGAALRSEVGALTAAAARRAESLSEQRLAQQALATQFDVSRELLGRAKAGLFARYGWRADELAAFGVRPIWSRGRKGRSKVKDSHEEVSHG